MDLRYRKDEETLDLYIFTVESGIIMQTTKAELMFIMRATHPKIIINVHFYNFL